MSALPSRVRVGATWGAVGGLVLALLLIRRHPHMHLHGGDVIVIFGLCIGLGIALGAAVGRFRSATANGDSARGEVRSGNVRSEER
jgi:hypothetical protein